MGLHFLKAYNREERNAVLFLCTEKTFRQWAWYIVKCIANLDKVIVRKACFCVLFVIDVVDRSCFCVVECVCYDVDDVCDRLGDCVCLCDGNGSDNNTDRC